ncbi:MAG: hypothetical protein AAGM67_18000, partial [Bacteroidota bacterium]
VGGMCGVRAPQDVRKVGRVMAQSGVLGEPGQSAVRASRSFEEGLEQRIIGRILSQWDVCDVYKVRTRTLCMGPPRAPSQSEL